MNRKKTLAGVALCSFLAVLALGILVWHNRQMDLAVKEISFAFSDGLFAKDELRANTLCGTGALLTRAIRPADDAAAALLYDAYYDTLSIRASSAAIRRGNDALQSFSCASPSFDALLPALKERMQEMLAGLVESSSRSDEIYDDTLSFRKEIVEEVFLASLKEVLGHGVTAIETTETSVTYARTADGWKVSSAPGIALAFAGEDFLLVADTLLEEASASLTYVRKHYSLPPDTHLGPAPDENAYMSTEDPKEITRLLATPLAVQLIDGRDMYYREDIDFIPGEPIRAYLDETILVIVWKEARYGCAETVSEIFLSDPSQLCRKIVNDTYDCNQYLFATQLAREAQAVLAIGGDLYDHPGRNNGIHVYDGEVRHFEPYTTDSCFFTADGEMLFAYRGQFATQEEAQAYVDAHNVRFSVCFGPALIENGVDVSPENYIFGEIHERYARGAIGKKDDGAHYLTLNMNQQGPSYWALSLLSEQTETMLSYGCTTAYALDGGQTCCTILGGELINRVQHGEEREVSDIIFFATALPPEK